MVSQTLFQRCDHFRFSLGINGVQLAQTSLEPTLICVLCPNLVPWDSKERTCSTASVLKLAVLTAEAVCRTNGIMFGSGIGILALPSGLL